MERPYITTVTTHPVSAPSYDRLTGNATGSLDSDCRAQLLDPEGQLEQMDKANDIAGCVSNCSGDHCCLRDLKTMLGLMRAYQGRIREVLLACTVTVCVRLRSFNFDARMAR